MYTEATPEERWAVWQAKPALREVYGDLFTRLAEACNDGLTIEVGSGIGMAASRIAGLIASDIVWAPRIDLLADASSLPLRDGSVTNLVGLDALHHFPFPIRFFAEAGRAVRQGGRIILIEPAMTPVGWAFYTLLHPEPVDISANPFTEGKMDGGGMVQAPDYIGCNQAIASLLSGRYRDHMASRFPHLRMRRPQWISLWAYPLSGGFQPWSLLPSRIVGRVISVERRLEPIVGRLLGFRVVLVWDRL